MESILMLEGGGVAGYRPLAGVNTVEGAAVIVAIDQTARKMRLRPEDWHNIVYSLWASKNDGEFEVVKRWDDE